ncbi:hypothetical protein TL16_g01776 [Triparma laevis f. inornata]|uniref:Uncharacterized protein n=2 Tax=Triparma laevis TaxID=1534972 RepID=A0A9W7FM00_9STRA|nr:hypothetical protein TL16_g01776 [Triparma laevis f. inornata]GMI14438.1 hypothetical protein TrLO_g2439 [Triparma laevis f. longispina]
MMGMFSGAKSFKSDPKEWNVEKVTDMDSLFNKAESFTSDCSRWSVGNCTNMGGIFQLANSTHNPPLTIPAKAVPSTAPMKVPKTY